jgi:predicted acylesterase/phospholipase RssA
MADPPPAAQPTLGRLLTLDGGGAKGFYTLGVPKEIEALIGTLLYQRFELVFGTSTGAIIAALVALGKLRAPNACVEEIDYRTARGLDKSVIRSLTQESAWVGTHENIFVLGPTGVGKSVGPALWHRRHVATGTLRSTLAPSRCFATW